MKQLVTFLVVFGSIHFLFASDDEKREELAQYTSLFALEVISTGLGTHLIKGRHFDIPARDQHLIAVAATRTWWTLPHMKRVSEIVRSVGQSSATEYLKCPPERRSRIYKYMFEKVELQLKLEPKVNDIYDREKSNASESGALENLRSGLIDIEDSKNVTKELQDAFIADRNLRIILVNTIFQEYGFADVFRNDRKDIYALARAIVELSRRPEFADQVNRVYRGAVHEIIASEGDTLYEQSGADLINEKLFPTLMRAFEAAPQLDAELSVMRANFSSMSTN